MAPKWKILRQFSGSANVEDKERRGFSSTIAKVFTGKLGAKDRPAQTSLLLDLPYELLHHIFDLVSKNELCILRGVCFQLEQLLVEKVFEEISINCTEAGSQRTGALLRQLATGKARVCRIARTLHIADLVPYTHPAQSYWQNPDIDAGLRPIQQNFLAPALKSLRNLTTVYWSVKVSDPYASMCDALAALPLLDSLFLTFDRWTDSAVFPLDKFQSLNLRRLHVEAGDYLHPLTCDIIPHLRKVLQNSTNLLEFSFTPTLIPGTHHHKEVVTLDDFFGDSSKPLPLTALRLSSPFLSNDMAAWSSLRNLTALDIPKIDAPSSAPLWKFLSTQSFHLQIITIDNISPELLGYLSTYSGLVELGIRQASCTDPELRRIILNKLYCTVLPRHRQSLRKFGIYVEEDERDEGWCLTIDHLNSLVQCTALREIKLFVYFEEDQCPVSLHYLMTSMSTLPSITLLHLIPVYRPTLRTGVAAAHFSRHQSSVYLEALENVVLGDSTGFITTSSALISYNYNFRIRTLGWDLEVCGTREGEDGVWSVWRFRRVAGATRLDRWYDGVEC